MLRNVKVEPAPEVFSKEFMISGAPVKIVNLIKTFDTSD